MCARSRRGALHEAIVYLWGEPGSGRTHLLRAAARANPALVTADDVEALDAAAQQALFNAINAAREGGAAVLAAGERAAGRRSRCAKTCAPASPGAWSTSCSPSATPTRPLYLRAEAARRGLRSRDEVVALPAHPPAARPGQPARRARRASTGTPLRRQRPLTLPLVREALSKSNDG